MDEINPFESPDTDATPPKRKGSQLALWRGIGSLGAGTVSLTITVYWYVEYGVVSLQGLGGSFALLAVGAMSLYYEFDDRR